MSRRAPGRPAAASLRAAVAREIGQPRAGVQARPTTISRLASSAAAMAGGGAVEKMNGRAR